MTDETLQTDTPTQDGTSTDPTAASAPAVAKNTDPTAEQHMIPKARFDEVNQQLKALKAEQAKAAKAAEQAEAERLKQQNEYKTLYENAVKAQEEAQAKAAALELASLKRQVADAVKLPAALASRLQGTTEEELTADAKALLETLPKPAAPALDGGAGKKGNGVNAPSWAEIQEQAARFGVNPRHLAQQYGVTPPN